MEKSNNNFLGILGCAVLYAVTSFACAFLGFLSPWCWIVVFPVLAAVLGAPSYLWAARRWQRFGVGTLFAMVLAVVLLVMGEIDFVQTILMVVVGLISDVVRQSIGTIYKRSILLAYPVLPLGILVWLMKLWTASEWYVLKRSHRSGPSSSSSSSSSLLAPSPSVLFQDLINVINRIDYGITEIIF